MNSNIKHSWNSLSSPSWHPLSCFLPNTVTVIFHPFLDFHNFITYSVIPKWQIIVVVLIKILLKWAHLLFPKQPEVYPHLSILLDYFWLVAGGTCIPLIREHNLSVSSYPFCGNNEDYISVVNSYIENSLDFWVLTWGRDALYALIDSHKTVQKAIKKKSFILLLGLLLQGKFIFMVSLHVCKYYTKCDFLWSIFSSSTLVSTFHLQRCI